MMKKIPYLIAILSAFSLTGCQDDGAKKPLSASQEIKGSSSKPAPQSQAPKGSSSKPAPTEAKETQVIDRKALKEKLTPMQYEVAVEDGTEPPFKNEYWDNKKAGIYVDIISGKPLFSSKEKFESGTGWPSFWEPIEKDEIVEIVDRKFGWVRTEVRSKTGDAHLGHVFDDGPKPTGLRYCLNSASLRFVPVEDFEKEGLTQYAKLFEGDKGEEKKP